MFSLPRAWHFFGRLQRLRRRVRRWARAVTARRRVAEPPLRAQLFNAEQMESHGRALARAHAISIRRVPDLLLGRLEENEHVLDDARRQLTRMVREDLRITPAGDWLLDNYQLIEEQIRTARVHLPKGYSRELPTLQAGPAAGMPRVFHLAMEAIAHGDGRIDAETMSRFVAAYQSITSLTLGELWAIPIMLRLALIENLRRMALRIMSDGADHRLAVEWAEKLNTAAEQDPKSLVLVLADMARSAPPISGPFIAELMRALHGRNAALAMPLSWIEQWVTDAGHRIEHLMHCESQQQAATQVSIGNSIGSLRFLGSIDWREFVETMSVVEATLREDPADIYARMDFSTRDSYRNVIEAIARRSGKDELEVARTVLALARGRQGTDDTTAHVGYYLIDDGLALARKAVVAATGKHRWLVRRLRPRWVPLWAYLLPWTLLMALFVGELMTELQGLLLPTAFLWAAAVLASVVFSELAISLVNWAATVIILPERLPRMDFSKGIPRHARAIVAVPTMIGGRDAVDALVEGLEVRYLANRDTNLHFALLTDFFDADQQVLPGDEDLLDYAEREINALNARHAPEHRDRFFLLHRPRLWNPLEGKWMGHERKRGKLGALNHVLRGDGRDAFLRIAGDLSRLADVRYVITLDTDTQLPRDAAREFVATLAHPLNQARFDERVGRVVRGYGILQPMVGVSMSGRRASRFAAICGSEPGIDPYTRMVSDVYQDLFGEGSFVGKGIYDIDAFERALHSRFPDNRILSHDLLEGCYARAGLVSDVRLYEDYPSRYAADVKRRARWIRGDWQLLPWLLPWVPTKRSVSEVRCAKPCPSDHPSRDVQDSGVNGNMGPTRTYERNPLSWLSRGKLLDNLRRSLVPASATVLLVVGWLLVPRPLVWTVWLVCLLLLPIVVPALRDLLVKPVDLAFETHLLQVARGFNRGLQRALLDLACLPYEACFSLDAIVRSLWRMAVSRRHLLQWTPSNEVEQRLGSGLQAELRMMWFAPVFALVTALGLGWNNPQALWVAGPILGLWFISPPLMAWLGRPPPQRRAVLTHAQRMFLRTLARRIWAFFEINVTAEDHWLPPDNLQEYPTPRLARRTSPTNIGLSLLSDLAAYDFGWLTPGGLIGRIGGTLATLEALARHRGHFYNWYDTRTLEPLPPRYISTVDSGNLAGHLLTLRQGLLALIDAPLLTPNSLLEGLADTFAVLEQARREAGHSHAALLRAVADFDQQLEAVRAAAPASLAHAELIFGSLVACAAEIEAQWPPPVRADTEAPALHWPRVLSTGCLAARDEAQRFMPQRTPSIPSSETNGPIPSLRESGQATEASVRRVTQQRIAEIERLAHCAGQCALMEFDFLYDRARHLLSIGYNVEEHRLDTGYYDLLASEARLAIFVGIAQGQLPQESWFALSRLLTEVQGEATLLSWSGSMFEYLMPQLVMPSYPDTLLDQTARHAVSAQIHYGAQRAVPWGMSESGYNAVDARMNYQYRAFGVPGLGLKRGLGEDLVIAPYASMMALMVAPEAAYENLQRLTEAGFGGSFGLHEAIDYTPSRVPPGQRSALLRSYMAHHQGMGLLALVHLLLEKPMQRRFVADVEFQATLLLLQERIPRAGAFHPQEAESGGRRLISSASETQLRVFPNPSASRPAIQLLSNGRYHALLSSAGGGYSRLRDMAVTRWREDSTCDSWGSFCYLRDVESGDFWSAAFKPTCVPVRQYEAIFSDAKAEFRGRRRGYEMHLEIAISAEDDMELRRLHVVNRTAHTRTIEITTYAEVVLTSSISDELHPAFSNLFVQTEIVREKQALLCARRPRSHEEVSPWMFHLVAIHDGEIDTISYETDRARFLGRGKTSRAPNALTSAETLSDTDGSVLDPIVAIRCRITLAANQKVVIDMVTGIAAEREASMILVDKYRDRRLADRVFDLAWTHSEVVRRQINATQADAQLFERLAGPIVYTHPFLRAQPMLREQNRRGQSGLWGYSISGDLPIVLVRIADAANFDLVRQMVQAHAYWKLKGLEVDLVIWNEEQGGYRQELQEQILGLVTAGPEANRLNRPGGIFVRAAHQVPHEDRILLQSVARVALSDTAGSLVAQIGHHVPPQRGTPLLFPEGAPANIDTTGWVPPRNLMPGLPPPRPATAEESWPFEPVATEFLFDNGIGAFSLDGREYVIVVQEGEATPAPWANVMANAHFGTVVSDSTPGYTWFENAHELRLTPWHNDPVADTSGEAVYLRDEENGRVWSPMPLPCRGHGAYRTRHGFGYSVYEHLEDGIASELWVFVALEDAVKFSVLTLRNLSGRSRRLTATGYVEWVLGDLRARSQMHMVCGVDAATGALTASNPYNTEFHGRVAFFDADGEGRTFTADRAEFLGRNGDMGAPEALQRAHLSGALGVGLDPCAAIQIPIELAPGDMATTTFRLGAARDSHAASDLAARCKASGAHDALCAVRRHWSRTLGTVQVHTPEPGFDVLVNGWLPYQTLACRYLARSGYYQSGGAFGFRDQLQDTMAMVHIAPALSREHLLRCAAHQFSQGDVLHWWHPPQGRGVRSRCSDDYLWLPLATCRYIEATGDEGVLKEHVGFLEGRTLNSDEESWFDLPAPSSHRQSLYQHCVLALRRGADLLGTHGLPLIGSGDWNDGMNRVGIGGRGESVWLGFFLFDVLERFGPVAQARGEEAFAAWCASTAQRLRDNLEDHAWDGKWYRRAWFDDGSPLGSASNEDCQIDSISQSWSVLSGAAEPDRARQAMRSLDERLVRRDAKLIQLLEPPFDTGDENPGYIRGYLPGVRENGGQYTHAAVWTAMAFAKLGDSASAWELARMINPIHHAENADGVARYKVEPYVLAADVYALAPHTGRGGWTWYTGSAGWMFRLLSESLLGLNRQGNWLTLAPCIPMHWPNYTLKYRHGASQYSIEIEHIDDGDAMLQIDGVAQSDLWIELVDDGAIHCVRMRWPREQS